MYALFSVIVFYGFVYVYVVACRSSVVCLNLAFMILGMNIVFYNYLNILDCNTDILYVYLLI